MKSISPVAAVLVGLFGISGISLRATTPNDTPNSVPGTGVVPLGGTITSSPYKVEVQTNGVYNSHIHLTSAVNTDSGGYIVTAGSDNLYLSGGIGYSSPSTWTAKSSNFEIVGMDGGNLRFYTGNGTAGVATTPVERMHISPTGLIGMGTATPVDTRLQLTGNASSSVELGLSVVGSGLDGHVYTRLGQTPHYDTYWSSNATTTDGNTWTYVQTAGWGGLASRIDQINGAMTFDTTSGGTNPITWNSRLFIANNGNVGIGTSNPAAKLTVQGTYSRFLETAGVNALALAPGSNGYNEIYSDFASGNTALPLALGSYPAVNAIVIQNTGNVGIGTGNPGAYKLAVHGSLRAQEVVVDTSWSDYVFDESYKLMPLTEVEQHIKSEKHLPGIPSAKDVASHGVSLGEIQSKLLAKIEELTLHQIEQEKEIARLRATVSELQHSH